MVTICFQKKKKRKKKAKFRTLFYLQYFDLGELSHFSPLGGSIESKALLPAAKKIHSNNLVTLSCIKVCSTVTLCPCGSQSLSCRQLNT